MDRNRSLGRGGSSSRHTVARGTTVQHRGRQRPKQSWRPRLEQLEQRLLLSFANPLLNFDGIAFTGVAPPDTIGDVGPNHYVQAVNAGDGARVAIFDKAGNLLDTMTMDTLADTTACGDGRGDPIVLYDHLADRWVLAEFADSDDQGNHLCVYVSVNGTPSTDPDDWYAYDFETPNFPDYPKITVWPDAYFVGTNESDNPVYALDRNAMLDGLPAGFVRSTTTDRPNWPRNHIMPADLDGPAPPPGTPGIFIRQIDDEVTSLAPDPTEDYLELWEMVPDFEAATASYTLAATIPIADFDYRVGASDREDIEQPGTTKQLDALPHYIMWRAQYRVMDGYESLVANFTVDANEDSTPDFDGGTAEERAGVRWFELRREPGGDWYLYQEQTYSPDADHRWMGSVAQNGDGDLALAYSVSSSTTYPSLRYAGRRGSDPLGALPDGEHTIVAGSGSQSDLPRWGDYSAMTVDPADDSTFWFTSEYVNASGSWRTRIAALSFGGVDLVISADDRGGDGTNTGGGDVDTFRLVRNGPALFIYIDGTLSRTVLFDSLDTILVAGSDDNDRLELDLTGGPVIPPGGLRFEAGGDSGVGDSISINGSGGVGVYRPDPDQEGDGVLELGGRTLEFTGLEPISIFNFSEFTLITPNSNDQVKITRPALGKNRISGSSGGVPFESLDFWLVTNFLLDTATNDQPLGDPNDRVEFVDGLEADDLESFTVRLGEGADLVLGDPDMGVTLLGGPGDDTLQGGAGPDWIDGGPGRDTLSGFSGADTIAGGDGDDVIDPGPPGTSPDVVDGGDGVDTIVYSTSPLGGALREDSGFLAIDGTGGGSTNVTAGSVENVQVTVDGSAEFRVEDLAGTSVVSVGVRYVDAGGASTLVVEGSSQDDQITADLDLQSIFDGPGPEMLPTITTRWGKVFAADTSASEGDRLRIEGLDGDDDLKASERIVDGSGDASLAVLLDGGAGADVLSADATLIGGPGDDTLIGGSGDDSLFGGAGNDLLLGGGGDDSLYGGEGEDTLVGGPGTDTVDGGPDFDTILVTGTSGSDVIDLLQASPTALTYTVNSVVDTDVLALDGGGNRTVEAVKVEAQAGDDLIRASWDDSLGVDAADNALRFVIDGQADQTRDRLGVTDDGPGDLVLYRKAADPDAGSITIGPANPEPLELSFSGIEFVQPLPAADGDLVVLKPDAYEVNDRLDDATHLGLGPALNVDPSIDPPSDPVFGFPADEDWYRVVAAATGTLDFTVFFRQVDQVPSGRPGLPGGGNINVEVYDDDGDLLTPALYSPPDADSDARARISAVQGQVYYFRVFGATPDVVNGYAISVSNVASPVPFDLELDDSPPNGTPNPPGQTDNSDTGRSQFDNVTYDNTPTLLLRLDDAIFLHDLPGNAADDSPPDEVIPIAFRPGPDQPTEPGYAIGIFDEGVTDPASGSGSALVQVPLGFATQLEEGLYTFTTPPLEDGSHFLTARVLIIDPADPQQTGWGDRSQSLEIVVDTVPPPVSFGSAADPLDGLHPDSDTGIEDQPATFVDRITADTTPTFWGNAEANAIIRVYADVNGNGAVDPGDVLLGETVASPTDGTDQFPGGTWEVRSQVDLNDPGYFPKDGHRRILVTAEDLAGNISDPQSLDIFIDTRGPRITNMEFVPLDGSPNVPVFTPKPLAPFFGPTPLTQAIEVTFEDEPVRVDGGLGFVYPAVNPVLASTPGNYRLVGDANGHILISDVVFVDSTVAGDVGRTTVRLVFATPLPDDRFTLTVTDRLADRAGNRLDGDVQATGPGTAGDLLPSGDGVPGEDFVGRFTVDSRPEIGVFNDRIWFIDLNGNGVFDPDNKDATNRDIVWRFGQPGDWPVVGDWDGDGFDEIGVYGFRAGVYMFELDVNGNGTLDGADAVFVFGNVNAQPIAGDWNGDGVDEVGLYLNRKWRLDLDGDFTLDPGETIATNMVGAPVAGDWDGDGDDDVGVYRTYDPGTTPLNRWLLDLDDNFVRNAGDLVITETSPPGGRKRPVAGDWNARGTSKIGLFKINPETREAEWFLDVDRDGRFEPPPTGTPGIPLVDQDIFYRFGDRRSEPVVGNLDPPPPGLGEQIPTISTDVSNRPRRAHRLTVSDDRTVLATDIESPSDRDWYVFRALKSGTVAIDVTTPQSPLDPMIVVRQGRKLVARNGNYNRTVDSHVEFAVKAGREYRVLVRSQRRTTGSYVMVAQYLNPRRDDHAGSVRRATPLTELLDEQQPGWKGAGYIERARDRDVFSFDVDSPGTYEVSIDPIEMGFDAVITVISSSGKVLGRYDTAEADPTDGVAGLKLELQSGRYFVRVEGHAGLRGEYSVHVDAAIEELLGG